MNEDKIKGQWKVLAGKIKAKWGQLTHDDVDVDDDVEDPLAAGEEAERRGVPALVGALLEVADGNSEYLAGKVQERYGVARDEAKRQVDDFHSTL